jgi:hypothetical protein
MFLLFYSPITLLGKNVWMRVVKPDEEILICQKTKKGDS